ncbi:unnamed protein product [Calypogeia fissa]
MAIRSGIRRNRSASGHQVERIKSSQEGKRRKCFKAPTTTLIGGAGQGHPATIGGAKDLYRDTFNCKLQLNLLSNPKCDIATHLEKSGPLKGLQQEVSVLDGQCAPELSLAVRSPGPVN